MLLLEAVRRASLASPPFAIAVMILSPADHTSHPEKANLQSPLPCSSRSTTHAALQDRICAAPSNLQLGTGQIIGCSIFVPVLTGSRLPELT
jgi:hypothetical protein